MAGNVTQLPKPQRNGRNPTKGRSLKTLIVILSLRHWFEQSSNKTLKFINAHFELDDKDD
jgi:hypothetical protein